MGNGSFDSEYVEKLRLYPSIGWALAQIGEAQGLQEVWRKTKPEIIAKLRESALVESAESSNRIEGVEVERSRLIPLILGAAKPKDRPEEEIVGYRNALKWIHSSHQKIKVSPASIKKLHKLAQGGLISDAGEWKSRDNKIVEFSQAYQQGYEIGRFISLERIIENTKEDYYRTLAESSADWHSSKHDLYSWWSYFLEHIKLGYQELKDRVDLRSGDSKTALTQGIVKKAEETK